MKKKNGKSSIEINNKKYYSIDMLAQMRNVSRWTISKRIDEYNIIGIAAHGVMMYEDDDKFSKKDPSKIQQKLKRNASTVSNYAGLYQLVRDLNTKVDMILDDMTSQNGHSELIERVRQLEKQLQEKNQTISQLMTKK